MEPEGSSSRFGWRHSRPVKVVDRRLYAVAAKQQAESLHLRASTRLAHLWQGQGKQAQARTLLAPVYEWFTEGFDAQDLTDAKALLEELA
jgi:predicted ATPase